LKKPTPRSGESLVKRHVWGKPESLLRFGNVAPGVSDLADPEVFVTGGHGVVRADNVTDVGNKFVDGRGPSGAELKNAGHLALHGRENTLAYDFHINVIALLGTVTVDHQLLTAIRSCFIKGATTLPLWNERGPYMFEKRRLVALKSYVP